MSCFSPMGKCEYRSTASGVRYVGVVFLVICRGQRVQPAVPTVSRRPRRQTLAPRHRGPDRPQAAGPHPRRRPPPELLVPTRLAWRPALARAAGGRAREDPCAVLTEQEARAQRPEAGLKGHSCVRKEAVYSTSFSNGRTDRARDPNTQGGTRGRREPQRAADTPAPAPRPQAPWGLSTEPWLRQDRENGGTCGG